MDDVKIICDQCSHFQNKHYLIHFHCFLCFCDLDRDSDVYMRSIDSELTEDDIEKELEQSKREYWTKMEPKLKEFWKGCALLPEYVVLTHNR